MPKKIIVAIDGYSSCGKSTMAKRLAADTGYVYVDTGAMYRALAFFAMQRGWLTDSGIAEAEIEKHISGIRLAFRATADGKADMYLNDENIERQIRSLEVANAASRISALGFVRRELVRQQQLMGAEKAIVMDGRDIGTVVFPEAELKIFVTASPQVRAMRRMKELEAKGEKVNFDDVLENLKERDYRDTHRNESPLRRAPDAIVIDNTELSPEMQQELLMQLFEKKTPK
jgi:cytidylate kinase